MNSMSDVNMILSEDISDKIYLGWEGPSYHININNENNNILTCFQSTDTDVKDSNSRIYCSIFDENLNFFLDGIQITNELNLNIYYNLAEMMDINDIIVSKDNFPSMALLSNDIFVIAFYRYLIHVNIF